MIMMLLRISAEKWIDVRFLNHQNGRNGHPHHGHGVELPR